MAEQKKTKISRKKTIYFRIIALILPFIVFLLLEILLRYFDYGVDLNLFIDHRVDKYEKFYMVNPYVGEKYFNKINPTKTTIDTFLKEKPSNGFRIFVMGSSTVYGFPYNKNLMASRILHERLQDAYPDKYIEVVNTAITAINSITLRDYINQILEYEPDAILFYAGHNEFYGALGVGSNETISRSPFLQNLHFDLLNLRSYQLLREGISWIAEELGENSSGQLEEGTLMKRIVNDPSIIYGSEKYNQGVEQFRNNLSYILEEAKNKGIPLFISDLVSNVKDLPPFGDVEDRNKSSKIKYQEAEDAYSKEDIAKAKKLFYEAKDLDPIRFRATEEMNQIIYDLAEKHKSILVPTLEKFKQASPNGIIGNELMSEHVHPNIDGQFLLADVFFNSIVSSKVIASSTNPYTIRTKDYYRRNWGYSALDSLIGYYNVKQLKSYWPFTPIGTKSKFRETFKPTSMIQTLAFSTIQKPDTKVETLHNILAGYYKANKKYDLALKEYKALIGINPTLSSFYNITANLLFEVGDLFAAEKYLKQSVKYVKTYFAFYMLGEIEYIKQNFDNAINAYTSALQLADEEEIDKKQKINLLGKLYSLYAFKEDKNNMTSIEQKLSDYGQEVGKAIQKPEFEYSKYVPFNIRDKFKAALDFETTNIDSSLHYLSLCLKINDSPIVNKTMGDILLQQEDTASVFYYTKVYETYKKSTEFLSKYCLSLIEKNDISKANIILNELITIDSSNRDIPSLKAAINQQ